jgi:hypothetical protein
MRALGGEQPARARTNMARTRPAVSDSSAASNAVVRVKYSILNHHQGSACAACSLQGSTPVANNQAGTGYSCRGAVMLYTVSHVGNVHRTIAARGHGRQISSSQAAVRDDHQIRLQIHRINHQAGLWTRPAM